MSHDKDFIKKINTSDTLLLNEQDEMYDYLLKKENKKLEHLSRIVEYENNQAIIFHSTLESLITKTYKNCKDILEDLQKFKKIDKIFASYERKIYFGIFIICLSIFLMLFYI